MTPTAEPGSDDALPLILEPAPVSPPSADVSAPFTEHGRRHELDISDSDGDWPSDREAWARQVTAALAHLAPAQRLVLQLAYFEEWTYRQIAARLQQPDRDVGACAATALRRLGELLDRC